MFGNHIQVIVMLELIRAIGIGAELPPAALYGHNQGVVNGFNLLQRLEKRLPNRHLRYRG